MNSKVFFFLSIKFMDEKTTMGPIDYDPLTDYLFDPSVGPYKPVDADTQKLIDSIVDMDAQDGQKRYYLDIVCRFCRKPGHIFRDCKEAETRCHLCKADHDPQRCPLQIVCFWCFNRGHAKQDCPNFDNSSRFCDFCDSSGHSSRDCELIWRQYIRVKVNRQPLVKNQFIAGCYKCGLDDHFGDFCSSTHSSYQTKTAFNVTSSEIRQLELQCKGIDPSQRERITKKSPSRQNNINMEKDNRRKSYPLTSSSQKSFNSSRHSLSRNEYARIGGYSERQDYDQRSDRHTEQKSKSKYSPKYKGEKNSVKKAKATTNPETSHSLSNITKTKGVNFYRDAKKVRQLNVLKGGKAIRDAKGNVIKEAIYQSKLPSGTQARVEPNRRWFENTRVVGQKELDAFRTAMNSKINDPYSFVLRTKQLPLGLAADLPTEARMHLLEADPFDNTFGPKAQRKRPKLNVSDISELVNHAEEKLDGYHSDKDTGLPQEDTGILTTMSNPIFAKGQSKRIWNELYKVIDSSDVIIHVLDARDPNGTRCFNVERHLKKDARHKQLVFVLNKCDLVPAWVTEKWKKTLEKEYPTVAFHANINNPFGKSALINLLRQFSKLHSDKKQISIGFVGYPNTGKSSIINTLKQKKVCTVAPIPGETRTWQYIALMKRIFLIDCPGVVYGSNNDSETDIILKGVVRVENVENTEEHIPVLLSRVRKEYMERTYGVSGWTDSEDFLSKIAYKYGKLLKGGEPDINTISKMVLNDWIRGKIPFYTLPSGEKAPKEKEDEGLEDLDQKGPKNVQQRMKNIRVTADFLTTDMHGPEGEHVSEESNTNIDKADESPAIEDTEADPEASWDEVFGGINESSCLETVVELKKNISENDDDLDDSHSEASEKEISSVSDEDEQEQKLPRKTTNKSKAKNFYTDANVKNRNRKKSKIDGVAKKSPNFKKVSGPSGSGKSTLLERLFAKFPGKFGFSVSHCTRSPRPGEVDGVNYNFIGRELFEEMSKTGKFIETAEFSGNLYGTSYDAIKKIEDGKKICVLDLEVKGVQAIKRSNIQAKFVFIQPPDLTVLEERLRLRKTETEDSLAKRLASAKESFDFADQPGSYDIRIINDDQDDAYSKFEDYIKKTFNLGHVVEVKADQKPKKCIHI
ncbi:P-loop containing nucleoside triphosphate hydrolase protein [Globomyces pollinis-pini]|nr:P-loop containing nucleoside triphosphate hydrolase protein [Globomyces pollinis-pini]